MALREIQTQTLLLLPMLTHRAPLFVLKARPYRPGKTWCDAFQVSAMPRTHTNPCHLMLPCRRMSSLARRISYIALAAEQGQAPRSHPALPQVVTLPFPQTPQQFHRGKVTLCSFHLSILPAVPSYRSVKLDIGNRESCPVAGKLHQACLTFQCHLQ